MDNLYNEFAIMAVSKTMKEAATTIGVTPSCISKHLKQLENEVGTPLLNRNAGYISLTTAGKHFLVYIQQCKTILEAIQKDFSSNNEHRITLTVGVAPFAFTPFLFNNINSFQATRPDLTIRIVEDLPQQLVNNVSKSLCDIAVICRFGTPRQNVNVTFNSVQKILLSLVVHKNHVLANKQSVSFADLKAENLLILNSDRMLKETILSHCLYEGFSPNIMYEGINTDHLIKMVRAGHGITFLPNNPLKDFDFTDLKFISLTPDIPVTTDLVYISDNTHPNTTELINSFISKFAEYAD